LRLSPKIDIRRTMIPRAGCGHAYLAATQRPALREYTMPAGQRRAAARRFLEYAARGGGGVGATIGGGGAGATTGGGGGGGGGGAGRGG
jgi:hypothetical protein